VRLAQAKGLPKRKVYFRHALKNALLPVVTLAGLYLPFLLSGAFVVEVIFAWPGMGRIAYEAIFAKDYPVIFAVNFIAAALVLAGNLLADLLYQFVDPRIRVQ
jgi:peptide/nickel transport system permease protein